MTTNKSTSPQNTKNNDSILFHIGIRPRWNYCSTVPQIGSTE
jgi:hypothetical protein